jgi:hypothetical protein
VYSLTAHLKPGNSYEEEIMADIEDGFDFKVIETPFTEILIATANHLERKWPAQYRYVDSARVIFHTRMNISVTTYNAIINLCADIPPNPNRKFLVLATAPLVRTLFEELISLIFILHDVPKYIQFLLNTGYTELKLEYAHCLKYHGSDVNWLSYMNHLDTLIKIEESALKLTPEQIADPVKKMGRWPTPGLMLKKLRGDHPVSPHLNFLEYLNSWMYRTLSGDSHLNFVGTVNRGIYFAKKEVKAELGENYKEILENRLEEYRTNMLWTTLTLLLSLVSEIDIHFDYGLDQRIRFLWGVFREYSEISKEFYDDRYSGLLK